MDRISPRSGQRAYEAPSEPEDPAASDAGRPEEIETKSAFLPETPTQKAWASSLASLTGAVAWSGHAASSTSGADPVLTKLRASKEFNKLTPEVQGEVLEKYAATDNIIDPNVRKVAREHLSEAVLSDQLGKLSPGERQTVFRLLDHLTPLAAQALGLKDPLERQGALHRLRDLARTMQYTHFSVTERERAIQGFGRYLTEAHARGPLTPDQKNAQIQALIDKKDFQGAVNKAVELYGLAQLGFQPRAGTPKVASHDGETNSETGAVTVGPKAFKSAAWLVSTLAHERTHNRQWHSGNYAQDKDQDRPGDKANGGFSRVLNELEAYDTEIEGLYEFGLSDAERFDVRRRRGGDFDTLKQSDLYRQALDSQDYKVDPRFRARTPR